MSLDTSDKIHCNSLDLNVPFKGYCPSFTISLKTYNEEILCTLVYKNITITVKVTCKNKG